ncbi:hypothetical protein AALB39_26180 [Lachnospiraceae bacterium 54-53]
MDLESKELLVEAIKTGSRVQDPIMSVEKLLAYVGAEKYAPACCNRIRFAGLVDEAHIMHINPSEKNLHMDIHGFKTCREILNGYMEPERVQQIYEYFECTDNVTRYLNNILFLLRNCSKGELQKMLREASETQSFEDKCYPPVIISEELKSRRLFRKEYLEIKLILKTCFAAIWYYHQFKWLPTLAREALSLSKLKTWQYDGGSYFWALFRFQMKHHKYKNPKKLGRDNLKRYVFLGVKAFGNECLKNRDHSKIKSMERIEWIYERSHSIMTAIGLLTPKELIQIFPIKKDYGGEKGGYKDYFSVMETIGKLPQNKPIGSAQDAADVLWNYANPDTDYFLMMWIHSIDDLSTYCNNDKPFKAFYSKRNKEVASV